MMTLKILMMMSTYEDISLGSFDSSIDNTHFIITKKIVYRERERIKMKNYLI